jgi:hypothetical protein
MKKIIYSALLICAGLHFSACKKEFLQTSSPSEYTPDLVFTSPTYTQYAIIGTYAYLTQDQLYSARLPLMYATNTDIEIVGASNTTYKEDGSRGLSNYMGTSNNSSLSKEWAAMYKVIERTNLCIDGIRNSAAMKTADSTVMKAYLGEAITLRSLMYFELIKNWGDVPYKGEPTKYDLSNVYVEPTDRDVIYDYLLTDLQESENYVPWINSNGYGTVERVTKGFIKGLIARIALFRGGYSLRKSNHMERGSNWQKYYELARTKCKEIMDKGVHQLNSSYLNIWKSLCMLQEESTFRENLFEVANGLARSGEIGYSIGVRFYTNPKYGFGNNANVVNTTAWYYYMFDQKDLRRDITVAYYTYSNNSAEVKEVFTANPFSFNIGKWDQRFMGPEWQTLNKGASNKIGYGINWCIMRYSDVLLMFAEAENALSGPTALAKDALKKVRTRAFADADKPTMVEAYVNALGDQQSFFNALVNERAFEFGGEAIRKYDLIRWNMLTSKIKEQREGIQKMLRREAPWTFMPRFLFYKYQTDNEILDKSSLNFYVDKGDVDITGYTRIKWLAQEGQKDSLAYIELANLYSSGLNALSDGRHLYPIPTDVIAGSQGTLTNSYGY